MAMKRTPPSQTDIFKAVEKSLPHPWMGLRPELKLRRGAPGDDGSKTWLLEDPLQGHYFELGEFEAAFSVCLMTEPDIRSAVEKLMAKTPLKPSPADIAGFLSLLQKERLAFLPSDFGDPEKKDPSPAGAGVKTNRRRRILKALTGYLFVKIPLARPDAFIEKLLPWAAPLGSRPFLYVCAVLWVLGILFAFQDWELYAHTANHLLTPLGAAAFVAALSFVKILHELAHALAAKSRGLFVRRMGVALMVFMPVFYCDVSDAWRLRSRRDRVVIAAAGVMTEFAAAGVALFFWSVSPEGAIRSVMFYFSGASLASSLFTNLNPLMRFDAYYILMDYLRVSNLRSRSRAFFLYYVRRVLVDWQGPEPEIHPRRKFLAAFGAFALAYRLFIFTVISVAVYHFVFKALGALLALAQAFAIVLFPLALEIRFLIQNRRFWGEKKKVLRSGAAAAAVLALAAFPMPRTQKLPGFLMVRDVAEITAPDSGRITGPLPALGKAVAPGETLLRIQSRALELKRDRLMRDFEKTRSVMETMRAGGAEGGYRKWLAEEAKRIAAAVRTADEALSQLRVGSPIRGRVVRVNETLGPGAYLFRSAFLMTVAGESGHEARVYADERTRQKLKGRRGARAGIVFEDMETPTLEGRLERVLDFPADSFVNLSLFDFAGGPMASAPSPDGRARPLKAFYPVIFSIPESGGLSTAVGHGRPCFARVTFWESALASFLRWAWRGLAGEGMI